MKVAFYELGRATALLKFVVIQARYQDKWIFVRQKGKNTWEIPGGRIEDGELAFDAARRELYEETGARNFSLIALGDYSVEDGDQRTYGRLYLADVRTLDELPDFEVEEVSLFDTMPGTLSYPEIQPFLHDRVKEHVKS